MAVILGPKIVFGVKEVKPITGIPEGAKVRIRMRNTLFACAFVKAGNEISKYLLKDNGDTWSLYVKQATNSKQ